MKRIKFLFTCSVMMLAALSAGAQAQDSFTDPNVDYELELPNATWKATVRPDGVHQHVEFVYGDRMDGHLRVRKEVVKPEEKPADIARRDADLKLRYIAGYVAGREERFAGRLSGVTFGYEFTKDGKAMAGRVYYLQADGPTVYTLHFTGMRDKLQRIRNQTDLIARSFRLKG
jgi:hypothetical protein